ncbi:MAG: alpha/beta fold hydrolase [Deltaproteobacteria bacterium]|nr:alpha/beta fold hydrolase [Deltaproteobacteria bacterium]
MASCVPGVAAPPDGAASEVSRLLPEMEIGTFTGCRGVEIVYGVRRVPASRATVVIVNGRNETFVKYRETIAFLAAAGFSVWAYDHRGQGFSGRLLADPEKGHVESYDDYVADLDHLLTRIVKADPAGCLLLAHSMGGTIALLHQLRHPGLVAGLALSSPMLGFPTDPWPACLVPPMLTLLDLLGFGRSYIIGGGPFRPEPYASDNVLTSDREHYEANQRLMRDHPRIRLGAPTNNWVRQSLAAIAEIRAGAGRIGIPLLLLQAGNDRVVDNRAQKDFCRRCPGCRLVPMAGSQHEILMEKPAIRETARRMIVEFFNRVISGAGRPDPGEKNEKGKE